MNLVIGIIIGFVIFATVWALLNYDIIELEDDKPKQTKRGKRKAKK